MAITNDWDIQQGYSDTGGLATTDTIAKNGWAADAADMKAAIVVGSWGSTIDTEETGLSLSIGATDGTNQGCVSIGSGAASQEAWCRASNARLVGLIDPASASGAMDMAAEFDAFVDEGIQIDTTNAGTADRPIGAIMFAGDMQADFRQCTFANYSTFEAGVDIGFTPDFVFVFGLIQLAQDDTAHPFNVLSVGAMSLIGGSVTEQCCMAFTHEPVTATPTPQRIQSYLANNRVAVALADDAVSEEVIGEIITDGYSLAGVSGLIECFVLAIKGTNRRMEARCRTSPMNSSVASDVIVRGGALNPIARILGGLFVSADNTIRTNRFAGSYGFGFHTASDEYYSAVRVSESGASTVAQSVSSAKPIFQRAYGTVGTPGATQTVETSTPSGGYFQRYDRSILDWDSATASAARMMDITIGKGPATRALGGRLLGGTIY